MTDDESLQSPRAAIVYLHGASATSLAAKRRKAPDVAADLGFRAVSLRTARESEHPAELADAVREARAHGGVLLVESVSRFRALFRSYAEYAGHVGDTDVVGMSGDVEASPRDVRAPGAPPAARGQVAS